MAVSQPGGLRSKVKGESNYNNKNHSSKKLLNFTMNDEMGMSL